MLQLENNTPFEAHITVLPDLEGVDSLFVTVKGTFDLTESTPVAAEQAPVRVADEYWGEPGRSSVRLPGEVHLPKPSTDVLLVGGARAPGEKPVRALDASVRVGPLEKRVRVFGDRKWKRGLASLTPGSPEPFTSMPLVFERAYGGLHEVDVEKGKVYGEARNPVGCGFAGKRSLPERRELPVPNLEDPEKPLRKSGGRSRPACFGPVAPSWEPRTRYVGTYDEEWLRKRAPYLPPDFDPRFFNVAAPELTADGHLVGGEPVVLEGVSARGRLSFALPRVELGVRVDVDGQEQEPRAYLENVLFEPDDDRMCLLWRAAVRCDKKALKVSSIRVDADGVVS